MKATSIPSIRTNPYGLILWHVGKQTANVKGAQGMFWQIRIHKFG